MQCSCVSCSVCGPFLVTGALCAVASKGHSAVAVERAHPKGRAHSPLSRVSFPLGRRRWIPESYPHHAAHKHFAADKLSCGPARHIPRKSLVSYGSCEGNSPRGLWHTALHIDAPKTGATCSRTPRRFKQGSSAMCPRHCVAHRRVQNLRHVLTHTKTLQTRQ